MSQQAYNNTHDRQGAHASAPAQWPSPHQWPEPPTVAVTNYAMPASTQQNDRTHDFAGLCKPTAKIVEIIVILVGIILGLFAFWTFVVICFGCGMMGTMCYCECCTACNR